MILPVMINDGLSPPPADTLTNRLAALSELALEVPNGGGGADVVAGYKAFLSEFGCRVGPFDVLGGDRDAKVSSYIPYAAAVCCTCVDVVQLAHTHWVMKIVLSDTTTKTRLRRQLV